MNAREHDGYTALHRAAMNGHLIIVEKLLEKGADTTLSQKHGMTAIDLALQNKHHHIVELLRNYY